MKNQKFKCGHCGCTDADFHASDCPHNPDTKTSIPVAPNYSAPVELSLSGPLANHAAQTYDRVMDSTADKAIQSEDPRWTALYFGGLALGVGWIFARIAERVQEERSQKPCS